MQTSTQQSARCSNCEQPLKGRYCYACGQRDVDYGRPFFRLIVDVLKEAFEVDGRIAKTIVPLLFRPGHLVSEYLAGRRVRYSSPLRLYIFISLVCIFALHWGAEGESFGELFQSDLSLDEEGISINVGDSAENALSTASAKPDSDPNPDPDSDPDLSSLQSFVTAQYRKLQRLSQTDPALADQIISDSFFDTLPKAFFAFVPTFAIFLKLLYWRRNFFDHIIFSLNHHSILLLLVTISILVSDQLALIAALAIFAHFFLGLRRVYGGRWIPFFFRAFAALFFQFSSFFVGTILALLYSLASI